MENEANLISAKLQNLLKIPPIQRQTENSNLNMPRFGDGDGTNFNMGNRNENSMNRAQPPPERGIFFKLKNNTLFINNIKRDFAILTYIILCQLIAVRGQQRNDDPLLQHQGWGDRPNFVQSDRDRVPRAEHQHRFHDRTRVFRPSVAVAAAPSPPRRGDIIFYYISY